MKRTLVLLFIVIVSLAGVGLLSYKQSVAPKPAPTTVSVDTYKQLEAKYATLQKVDTYKLKQVADQNLLQQQRIATVTSQRDSLCATYKTFKPAPTPAQCQ